MGTRDVEDQLEVAKAEMVRLEAENAELRALMVELKPAEVLVEGSYFAVDDLPAVLGNYMRASDEYAREAKKHYLRTERAEARVKRAEAVIAEALDAARASSVPLGMPEAAFYRAIKREVESILATYQNGDTNG